mmetsp:Transcript_29184/g.73701  ORF Transcript_29184/g.73701 Transcript_29184/m.73701 type:complete len:145 (+) Transcript_29184:115-549(+)
MALIRAVVLMASVLGSSVTLTCAEEVKASEQSLLQAGTHVHEKDSALRDQMHQMMAEDDSDDIVKRMSRHGGLVQVNSGEGAEEKDPYIQEAEEGLSAALGPRWNAQKLENEADQNTQELLRGIRGGRTLGAIHGMMDMMKSIR